jgi:hypothetical protein
VNFSRTGKPDMFNNILLKRCRIVQRDSRQRFFKRKNSMSVGLNPSGPFSECETLFWLGQNSKQKKREKKVKFMSL